MKFFENIQVGDRYELGRHTFGADEIKAFARRFDPQRFHVDEEQAAQSHFGALCASGWHTAATWMRYLVAFRKRQAEDMRARGEKVAASGPALGMRNLKWLKPVYADDTLTYAVEVIETRNSNSRADRGLITTRGTGVNQRGELVLSFESVSFVERRPERR